MANMKEILYDGQKVVVEVARRDSYGTTIVASSYATTTYVTTQLKSYVTTTDFDTFKNTLPSTYVAISGFKTNYLDTNHVAYTDVNNVFTDRQDFISGNIVISKGSAMIIGSSNDNQGFVIANNSEDVVTGYYGSKIIANGGTYTWPTSSGRLVVSDELEPFITKDVNNLTNYYTTSNTYNKTEIDNALKAIKTGAYQVVATLPTTGEEGIVYLQGSKAPYHMYIWEGSKFIHIGDTDLELEEYVKVLNNDAGTKGVVTGLSKSGNTITVSSASISSTNGAPSGQFITKIVQDDTGKITSIESASASTSNQKVKTGTTTFVDDAIVNFLASSSNTTLASLTVAGNASSNSITYTLNTDGITTELNKKQATLTAGNGITITSNTVASVITATDVTIGS